MEHLEEIDLIDRTIVGNIGTIVKIQALWRGFATRKRLAELQELYLQIFQEIEQSSEVLPYWSKRSGKKPEFLRLSEYESRKAEDEKDTLEKQRRKALRKKELVDTNSRGQCVTEDGKNEGLVGKDICLQKVQTNAESSNDQHRSKEIKSQINQRQSVRQLKDDDRGMEMSSEKAVAIPAGSEVQPNPEMITETHNPENVSTITTQDNQNSKNNESREREISETEKVDDLMTSESGSVSTPNIQEEKSVTNPVNPGIGIIPTETGEFTALVSEKSESDTDKEPVKDRSQRSDPSVQQTMQQTSFWESGNSTDHIEDVDLEGMSQEDLKKQKSLLGMELLWIQQAIESRKQYLRLKGDISA